MLSNTIGRKYFGTGSHAYALRPKCGNRVATINAYHYKGYVASDIAVKNSTF